MRFTAALCCGGILLSGCLPDQEHNSVFPGSHHWIPTAPAAPLPPPPPPVAGQAVLSWQIPTTNVDGTPLAGPIVYRINTWNPAWPAPVPPCYVAPCTPYPQEIADVWISNGSVSSYTYENLPAGTWFFWMQACYSQTDPTTCGPMSNIVSKEVT